MANQLHTTRFQLVPYFAVASLVMFVLVAGALFYFERDQEQFFTGVQNEQIDFFRQVQNSFAEQQEEIARRDLLAIHESGNVNLTRLFANALWEDQFAPFVAQATQIPIDHCRSIPDIEVDGQMKAPTEKKACFKEVGERVMALPDFEEINAKVFESMLKSSVLKIKVFDRRGLTVYSSDHSQIGDDKLNNPGWQSAMRGVPASTLTHRGTFDAFEGTVEERDVIGSYQPVYQPGTDNIVGVFEVYTDVTPFLNRIKNTSGDISLIAATNQEKVESAALGNQQEVKASSNKALMIVAALLVVLFGSLFVIVRRADSIIKEQGAEREKTQQQLSQAEKMASLGQMVAGVAHQLNTPLAFSHSNISMVAEAINDFEAAGSVVRGLGSVMRKTDRDIVPVHFGPNREKVLEIEQNLPETQMLKEMMDDTLRGIDQMKELVDNLRDFTRLDRSKITEFDLNAGLHNVLYIAKSVIPTRIEVVEEYAEGVPPIVCTPSQLNQVFLNLINNAAQAIEGDGKISVRTVLDGDNLKVEVSDTGSGIPDEVLPQIFEMYYTTKPEGEGTGMGLAIARTIAQEHGGDIDVVTELGKGTTFTVTLPLKQSV